MIKTNEVTAVPVVFMFVPMPSIFLIVQNLPSVITHLGACNYFLYEICIGPGVGLSASRLV